MTLEFQESLLRFLFQDKQAKKYKDYLDQNVFDVPTWQLVYGFWRSYVDRYNSVPSKANMLEYVDRIVKKHKGGITNEVYTEIQNTVAVAFMPDINDYEFTRDVVVEFAKRKQTRNLFNSEADKIKNASDEEIDAIYHRMGGIVRIGEDSEALEKNRGGFLFRDANSLMSTTVKPGKPTFLHDLNRMTAARGFFAPMLILLLGAPKAFKTGTILKILIEYARSGMNIFIADAENGLNSLKARIAQALLECERQDIVKYHDELAQILKKLKSWGGEIVPHFFPANVSTLDNVDAELERLAEEEDWRPDIIFYDYLQLFASANKKITDKRLQIQDVYHHAIRLNNKWDTFAFTAAKVKAEATNKLVIDVKHFSEDFGQAYNCHAAFALCRTEDEVKEGNGRIIPVVQREGTAYKYGASTTCAIKIEESIMNITELDSEIYMSMLEEQHENKKKKTGGRFIPIGKVKDE